MITEKINQIEKLVTVPSAEIDPDGASNAMQILIHLTELRDLVDSDSLPPVSEWVAVEDALPDENKRVLIYDGTYVCVGSIQGMWTNDSDWLYGDDLPTHWKPLPEPPCR